MSDLSNLVAQFTYSEEQKISEGHISDIYRNPVLVSSRDWGNSYARRAGQPSLARSGSTSQGGKTGTGNKNGVWLSRPYKLLVLRVPATRP